MQLPLRVVLVDDQDLARALLRRSLEADGTVTVIGEGADGEQAVALVGRLMPDLVLLDVRMPRMDGLAAAREIAARWPAVAVVLCSTDPAPPDPPAPFVAKESVTAAVLHRAHDGAGSR